MGRHAARALECSIVADRALEWLDQLSLETPTCSNFAVPATGSGVGLTEAPRGALAHWIRIRDRKIENIKATGAPVVASGNIVCMMQLAASMETPVVHTVELLDWATGGQLPAALQGRDLGPVAALSATTIAAE